MYRDKTDPNQDKNSYQNVFIVAKNDNSHLNDRLYLQINHQIQEPVRKKIISCQPEN